jgi:hypothetical protein
MSAFYRNPLAAGRAHRTGTQHGKPLALLGVSVADELLVRNGAFVNRLTQVFLLVMGIWFLWTGFAGRC